MDEFFLFIFDTCLYPEHPEICGLEVSFECPEHEGPIPYSLVCDYNYDCQWTGNDEDFCSYEYEVCEVHVLGIKKSLLLGVSW